MFKKISDNLKALILGTGLVENVYDFEASDLSGTPTCTITPSANESYYDTTIHNRRTYGFMIRLYVLRATGNNAEKQAEEALKELTDAVLNALDRSHQMPGLVTQAGYTFLLMHASPSKWGYVGREDIYRVAEIEMQIGFQVDVEVV